MGLEDTHIPSPALLSVLRKRFLPAEVKRIESLYQWAAEHGALTEIGIERARGVSYNPRPARICQILIQDGKHEELLLVEAALLAAITDTVVPSAEFGDAAGLAAKAKEPRSAVLVPGALAIAFSLAIDAVRHLHMSADSIHQEKTLRFAAELLGHSGHAEPRLRRLLEGAVAQQQDLSDAEER